MLSAIIVAPLLKKVYITASLGKEFIMRFIAAFVLLLSSGAIYASSDVERYLQFMNEETEDKPAAGRDMSYCVRCHEMGFAYDEYLKGPHANKATCKDCHQSPGVSGLVQKSKRGWDHFVTHNYSTQEKYDANRLQMAKAVWKGLRETQFQTCRACHNSENFKDGMKELSVRFGGDEKLLCTECHKGMAHNPPEELW